MNFRKFVALGLAAGLSAFALSGCAGETTAPGNDLSDFAAEGEVAAELDALYKEAQESGELEVVAYGPPGALNDDVANDFKQAFPDITIKYEYLFGAELQSRVQAEYSQGQPNVDVFLSGAVDNDSFRESGYLEPYLPSTAETLDEKFKESHWASPIFVVMGPLYNTAALQGDDVPTTWSELTDARFKGQVGMSDPTVPATAAFMIGAAMKEGIIDESWLDEFSALEPKIFPSQTASVQAIASGQSQLALLVSYNNYLAAKDDGAPVGFSILEEGVFAWPQSVALASDASAEAAAKLFIAWLYTEQGQESVAKTGIQGTMPDAPRVEGLEDASLFTYPHEDVLSEYANVDSVIEKAFVK